LGNINFTFIKNLKEGIEKAVNYKQFLEPVRSVLQDLDIPTTYSQRDDLLLNGLKISGNAQHIYQKGMRLLHHGTLLYNSDLKSLNTSIHSKGKYEGKSVPSNRSEVTNIVEYKNWGSVDSFLEELKLGFEQFWGTEFQELSEMEIHEIQSIQKEKFETDKWIVGYSPKYTHTRSFSTSKGVLSLEMYVVDGVIQRFEFSSDQDLQFNGLIGEELTIANLQTAFPQLNEKELLEFF